ncbi:MAG: competence protein CoiA family protein [Pseudomonadota bacterium]
MQYALVENQRREAFSGGKGTCPQCGSAMVAKCGPQVIHHWAHSGRRNCDPWWENETPWHRQWKSLFPEHCREISHAAADGEIHRADIVTPTGIFVEVQHSAISDAERASREAFYGNLVWIVDGRSFANNFDIYHMLPDPRSAVAQDLVWGKAQRQMKGANAGLFIRVSEASEYYPGVTKATVRGGEIHSIRKIENEIIASYCGHHQYDWVRPRRTWLDAKCPVYIDFGEDNLVRLEIYDETNLPCIRYVSKRKFLHDVMVETKASDIATRFYGLQN